MKKNIDLTENGFFSRGNFFKELALGVFTISSFVKSKYPWTAYLTEIHTDDDLDLDHQKQPIIIPGNKIKRAEIKGFHRMDELNYCDCCGIRMNIKPWDEEIGICHKCNDYYEKDKCLWCKKEVIRNAIIRIA